MPKTPITYYGGKLNMLKHILPNIPPHTIYTETFFGGGAVFFAKTPAESEVINDINAMVTNFYAVCKSDFAKLKAKVDATLFARVTYIFANTIYNHPLEFNALQRAWAFYVATNMGFGARVGSWGFDKYGKRVKAFRNKKMLFDESIVQRLENVQVEHNDACKVLALYNTPDAFHYVDPPYINSNQGHYGGYTEDDFRNLLDMLTQVKGKFLLSSYPSDILDEYIAKHGWYSKQFSKPLTAKKGVLGNPRTAKKTEVLTANYPLV